MSLAICNDISAKSRSSFGGSRSWSSSRSSSRSSGWSSSKSTKPSSSKPSSASKSSWNSKSTKSAPLPMTKTASRPKLSPAQQKVYDKAAKNGTLFKSKSAAVSDFKSKYASKYSNKFTSQPTTRPEYIPQTYRSGGHTYNITYNQGHGGYGYWSGGGPGLGTWMMYDMMSDAIMMNAMMNHQGYYVQSPVVDAPVVVESSGHFFTTLVGIFVLILIFIVIVIVGVGIFKGV